MALNRSVDRASGTEWKKAKLKRELEALREAHSTKNAKFEELCERAVAYGASDEASLDGESESDGVNAAAASTVWPRRR